MITVQPVEKLGRYGSKQPRRSASMPERFEYNMNLKIVKVFNNKTLQQSSPRWRSSVQHRMEERVVGRVLTRRDFAEGRAKTDMPGQDPAYCYLLEKPVAWAFAAS